MGWRKRTTTLHHPLCPEEAIVLLVNYLYKTKEFQMAVLMNLSFVCYPRIGFIFRLTFNDISFFDNSEGYSVTVFLELSHYKQSPP